MIHIEMVTDRNQDISGLGSDGFRCEFAFQFQVELVHFHVLNTGVLSTPLGNRKNDIQQNGKYTARHGGDWLRKQVNERDQEQCQRDQSESERNLFPAYSEVQRHLEFALAGIRVAQDQHRQAVHGKTPDHTEGVQVCQERYVAAADKNVDDPVAGAKARMRLTKPVAEYAVFRDAVEHAIRTDDCSIDGTGKDHSANHHHEAMEDQAHQKRPFQVHSQSANKIFQETLPDIVRNDHHREERN